VAEERLNPLEIQHNLLSADEREALASAILNATVEGHAGFTRVMLTIMAFTAGGRISPEQAEVLTKQAELLFTNLCAANIREERASGGGGGVAADDAAQAGAKKIRPSLLYDSEGRDEYGLEVLDAQGRPVPLKS
jgi:hypothetical protein